MIDPSPIQFDDITAMSGTNDNGDQQSAVVASRAKWHDPADSGWFVKTQALSSTFVTLTRMCYTQQ